MKILKIQGLPPSLGKLKKDKKLVCLSLPLWSKYWIIMALVSSALVEHSLHHSKDMGLSLAAVGTEREEIAKMTNNGHKQQICY